MDSLSRNAAVAPENSQSGTGNRRAGGLSRFMREAVRANRLELKAEQVKTANLGVGEGALEAMIAEALSWARQP